MWSSVLNLLVITVVLTSTTSCAFAEDGEARDFWVEPEGVDDPQALELIAAEKRWWLDNDSSDYTYLSNGAKFRILSTAQNTASEAALVTPTDEAVIRVHYEVRLANGTVVEQSWSQGEDVKSITFDEAVEKQTPRSVKMNSISTALVPGVKEALLKMHIDDEFEVVVPSRLAFGPVSVGRAFRRTIVAPIPAYSTLIVRIRCLDILFFEDLESGSKKLISTRTKLHGEKPEL